MVYQSRMVAIATRSPRARNKFLCAAPWRPTYFVGSRMLRMQPNKKPMTSMGSLFGVPDRIRTYDLWLRKPTLYPAELRVHNCVANT